MTKKSKDPIIGALYYWTLAADTQPSYVPSYALILITSLTSYIRFVFDSNGTLLLPQTYHGNDIDALDLAHALDSSTAWSRIA